MSTGHNQPISIRRARWPEDMPALRLVRDEVFVIEQSVPVDLEWDGQDADSWHVIATAGALPVATGRLQASGKIGRMAVRSAWRGSGLGTRVLDKLIQIASEQQLDQVFLHAQIHALDFYAQHGFSPYGDEFEEAGIPHCAMRRRIDQK